jgi:hypothetical protein
VEKPRLIKPTYPHYQIRPSIHVVKLYGLQAKHLSLKKIWEMTSKVRKIGGNLLMKKFNDRLPFCLQLFADETPSENESTGTENTQSTEEQDNQEKNKASEKKYSDEDLNAILDKRFARWKADQEKEKAEAKRLAEMNAQERAEAERDKVQKELDELKAKNAIAEMTNEARKMCAEHDINVGDDLLSVLVNKDADKTKKAVDAFVKMFESEVEKAVKEKLKGNGPKRGGSNKGVTRESILNITDPMERQRMIAENMDLFQ